MHSGQGEGLHVFESRCIIQHDQSSVFTVRSK